MARKKLKKKVTNVRQHPRQVSVSPKNPEGIIIVDQHLRRLKGTYLDSEEIESIFNSYDRKKLGLLKSKSNYKKAALKKYR